MKKYFILAIRYTFYIAALLFFDDYIKVIGAILLISTLFLDNKYYSILPIILCFYIDSIYTIILISVILYHFILKSFIKRNRYYALSVFILSLLTSNILILINKSYNLNILFVSLISLIIYSIINMLHIYHNKGNKHYTIALNDNLIHLTLLLGYLLLIIFYNPLDYLFFFLFMQLFIINDIKYNLIFFIVSILMYLFRYQSLNIENLSYISTSFIPHILLFKFDYTKAISYLYALYAILVSLLAINKKNKKLETDYISNLFKDFKKYINDLNIEYDNLNTLKELKENHLEAIQNTFCNSCKEDSICKYKQDKRYSFLCNAMNNDNNNIYNCPHYNEFYFNNNIQARTSFLQFNAITSLADELEYLYNQNIKMASCYNKFLNELSFYEYNILNIDINLAAPTIYFSLVLSKEKQIIEEIFLRLSHKAFHEELAIKTIENENDYIIYIYKKPKVRLDYSHKILAKNENIISGDNYYIKKDFNESYIFALSDGMGSGHNAYRESSETLKLISHLSTYHFSLKTILKMLENIYDLKCEYDSYATLDILNINTSNMKLNLYKLGSSTTYIYHNGELKPFENKALPLKLDDINSAYELEYFKDDVILLLSDGISDFISRLELKNEINFNKSSEDIQNQIINKLLLKEKNELKDDASLIVIKII